MLCFIYQSAVGNDEDKHRRKNHRNHTYQVAKTLSFDSSLDGEDSKGGHIDDIKYVSEPVVVVSGSTGSVVGPTTRRQWTEWWSKSPSDSGNKEDQDENIPEVPDHFVQPPPFDDLEVRIKHAALYGQAYSVLTTQKSNQEIGVMPSEQPFTITILVINKSDKLFQIALFPTLSLVRTSWHHLSFVLYYMVCL